MTRMQKKQHERLKAALARAKLVRDVETLHVKSDIALRAGDLDQSRKFEQEAKALLATFKEIRA